MANEVVKVTKQWIERFVIGLRLCPFAHFSFYNGTIYYEVQNRNDRAIGLDALLKMARVIRQKSEAELSNAFMIFDNDLSFMDLLDLKEKFDDIIENDNHEIPLQSVVFHPHFQFADEEFNAHGNFINRSPYGMIHILRAEEVARAIEATPNVEEIPFRNKALLEQIGITNISEVFEEDFVEKNRV